MSSKLSIHGFYLKISMTYSVFQKTSIKINSCLESIGMIAAHFERDQTPKGFHNLQLVLAGLPYKISHRPLISKLSKSSLTF